jgi:hypothetical protein
VNVIGVLDHFVLVMAPLGELSSLFCNGLAFASLFRIPGMSLQRLAISFPTMVTALAWGPAAVVATEVAILPRFLAGLELEVARVERH